MTEERVGSTAPQAQAEAQLLGWQILEEALRDHHLDLVVGVAGKPVTLTMAALYQSGDGIWANHEAVAFQMAFGVAGCGGRSAALVKQVGMNAGLDVLACAAPHRSGGSMVVIVGDDPGGAYSSNEGDARMLAAAIDLPCLEPAGAADIQAALFDALALSTSLHVPTVLRVTSAMMLDRRAARQDEHRVLPPTKPFDPEFWHTDAEGQRRSLLQAMQALDEDGATTRRDGGGGIRIIGCGEPGAAALAQTSFDLLLVRRVLPLPRHTIADFLSVDDRPVLVLEDGGPMLEEAARQVSRQPVLGRHSGQVPWTGIIDVNASVEAALRSMPVVGAPAQVVDGNPAADLRPYGTLWDDAAALGLTPIAVDAGHASAAVWHKGDPSPFCVGLGSAVGVAAGVAIQSRHPVLAVTGDMAAFHSGILGLLQVVREQLPVITVVCDDGAASYTGGQPHPGSVPKSGQRRVDLREVVEGIGIDIVEEIPQKLMTSEVLQPLLRRLAAAGRPSVVIIDAR
ncbi:MAG TPA: thiamine pyrophosphate-dependent enzyme [Candidatus Dormibacteraeota bacterium]|nr:thiamine pyrophosphate-dependent enzyme [Candidatus Dormibacteraeota bacterium]